MGVVFSFGVCLGSGVVPLCLLGLHVVGAVNIASGVASRRVDHVADAIPPTILEDPARAFPADVALARCLMADPELSSFAQGFHLRDGSAGAGYSVALVCHG